MVSSREVLNSNVWNNLFLWAVEEFSWKLYIQSRCGEGEGKGKWTIIYFQDKELIYISN